MKISDLFEDATLAQLHANIRSGFPNTKKRQHVTSTVTVNNIHIQTDINKKQVLVSAETRTSDSGNNHQPSILLRDVNFQPPNLGTNVELVGTDGQKHSITPIRLNTNTVAVTCDCEDYQMRFAPYNVQHNCHLGQPPAPYQRKTTTRPEANPTKIPGVCKHLLRLVNALKHQKILI